MFEQAFIEVDRNSKKPYTLLVSLLLQVTALVALILVPLIYTQVLPQAKLRSVFAAPMPPAPALPKPPSSATANPARTGFRIIPITIATPVAPMPKSVEPSVGAAPDLVVGSVAGDSYSPVITEGIAVKPPDPPRAPAPKPVTTQRVRIGTMEESKLIRKVQPIYPHVAQQIRLEGRVEFTAVISKSGSIENLQLVHGHPLLVAAAREAILQWRYKPTLLNGEAVEVITNIEVNFTLTRQ